jgi:hypothetical protein
MGYGGDDFTSAAGGKFSEKRGDDLARDIRKGVAVEEEERSLAVAVPEKLDQLFEGARLTLPFLPFTAARFLSFSISAVLRASSCARSSVEADDRLPTPVIDKSGSGL